MKKALLASLFVLPISVSHGASLVYRNAVLANNPVVYYEFDEVGGATATDTVGSVNGTYVGAIGYGAASGAANLGSAVDFTGGYVDLQAPTLGTFAQSTVEAWFQFDVAVGGCCSAILASDGWDPGKLHLNLNAGSVVEHAVNSDAQVSVNTAAGLSAGTWYHLVVTNDTPAAQTNYYLNGALVADTGNHSTQNVIFGTTGIQIGAWDGGRLFDGRMDEFAVYDSVLSLTDVAAHFAAASAVPEPSGALLLLLGGTFMLARRRR